MLRKKTLAGWKYKNGENQQRTEMEGDCDGGENSQSVMNARGRSTLVKIIRDTYVEKVELY